MINVNIHDIVSITFKTTRLHQGFASRELAIETQSKYDDTSTTYSIALYGELAKQLVPSDNDEVIRMPSAVEADNDLEQAAS